MRRSILRKRAQTSHKSSIHTTSGERLTPDREQFNLPRDEGEFALVVLVLSNRSDHCSNQGGRLLAGHHASLALRAPRLGLRRLPPQIDQLAGFGPQGSDLLASDEEFCDLRPRGTRGGRLVVLPELGEPRHEGGGRDTVPNRLVQVAEQLVGPEIHDGELVAESGDLSVRDDARVGVPEPPRDVSRVLAVLEVRVVDPAARLAAAAVAPSPAVDR